MRGVCGTSVCTRLHAVFIQSSYNPYTSIRRGNTGLDQWNEQTIIILPSLHISLFASRYISHTLIPTHHPRHSIMYCDTERSRLSRLIPSPSRSIDHARNATRQLTYTVYRASHTSSVVSCNVTGRSIVAFFFHAVVYSVLCLLFVSCAPMIHFSVSWQTRFGMCYFCAI